MSTHGLALQSFTSEIASCLENLKEKRDELQAIIDIEELEKARLQAELETLTTRLSLIMTSLTRKTAVRADFDRAISESETSLCRLLENSQMVVNNVRREISILLEDGVMKTVATCPTGSTEYVMMPAQTIGQMTGEEGAQKAMPLVFGIRTANGL